jgi:uncharacterized protein (DUF2384 family)
MSASLASPSLPAQQDVGAGVDRKAIAAMLMKLFDHWGLSTQEQLDAMGFSPSNRALLARYRRGEPIAGTRDTLERAGHLLGIHKNLRLLFPHNRDLAYGWMRCRNKAFDNRSPIDVICESGFAGLLMVLAYLDRVRGQ